ncbi:hypothetical protein [Dechloromonas agitata]|uniref:hypothetical protein n=1 Tax=Dechloromonas agitata TaxID=73030 RepID=UPI0004B8EF59|nr:hypothetical protein [Dechloromonas agitata]
MLYSINAKFAAVIVRSYLECGAVDAALIQDLAYRLHYRDETALNLSTFAEYLERTATSYPTADTMLAVTE